MTPYKLMFVANDLTYFISHRLEIAIKASESQFDVCIVCLLGEVSDVNLLESRGIKVYFVDSQVHRLSIYAEFKTFLGIYRLFRLHKPDVVHLVTIRPYLYGGIAARLAGVRAVVSAVAGLGSLFIGKSLFKRAVQLFLKPLIKYAFGSKNQCVIIQNKDDQDFLIDWGVLKAEKAYLIPGSGVDLSKYSQLQEPAGRPIIALTARLLRDKGVYEFIEAAKLLHDRGVDARFWLIGSTYPGNFTSVSEEEVATWRDQGIVEVLGYRTDIPNLYAQSHIVCLPSYREGLPKSLVEGAAAGRAIVTTDVPGCRDAIIPNKTGLLVPVKDAERLADALQWLVEHPIERVTMGQAGRELAEQKFAIHNIVDEHIKIYQRLLGRYS